MNSSSNSNISAEVAREFRRMCEVAGIDVDEFFRILHLVIRQLEEGVLATSNTNATTGQPPSAPAPPPSLLITSTASSALRRANPIARSIRRVHFRAPLECGTGPVRRNGNNRFFCIIVGRHVGVFPGPIGNIRRHVRGVAGAAFTSHATLEEAELAFENARHFGVVRRIYAARTIQVIELTDTESEHENAANNNNS